MDVISELLGRWSGEFNSFSCLLKICICLIVGIVMGSERAKKSQAAGLKTYVFVSVASLLAGLFDYYMITVKYLAFSFACPLTMIATAIISSNTILFNSKNQFRGLTTAVGLICAEAVSLVVAHGLYFVGLSGFILYLICSFALPKIEVGIKRRSETFDIYVELKAREDLNKFVRALRDIGVKVNGVELNPAYSNSGLAVYTMSLKINKKELAGTDHKDLLTAISELDTVNYIEEIL